MAANPLKRRLVPRRQLLASVLIGLVTLIIVYVLIALSMTPVQYDIEAGDVAPERIPAWREVTDQISTDAAIVKVRAEVPLMYALDTAVTEQVQQGVKDYFIAAKTAMEAMRDAYITAQVKESNYSYSRDYYLGLFDAATVDWPSFLTDQQKRDVRSLLSDPAMPDDAIIALAKMDAEALQAMADGVEGIVAASLGNGVREENLRTEKMDVEDAIKTLYPDMNGYLAYFPVDKSFKANMLVDDEATEQARNEAAAKVDPIIYKQNQTIVNSGEVVTKEQLAVLQELRLVGGDELNYALYAGLFVMLVLIFGVYAAYLYQFESELLVDTRKLFVLSTVILVVALLSFALSRLDTRIIPAFFGTMLACVLVSQRSALALNVFFAFVLGMMTSWESGVMSVTMLGSMMTIIVGGSVSVFMLHRPGHRSSLIYAGLSGGVASMMVTALLNIIGSVNIVWDELFIDCAFAVGSGLLAGVLGVGTLPIWEAAFRVSTPAKLLELSNPNHPLIKRLTIEAPGTYHHSILTANLAEAGADAVGANALLCRVGAYFHDVGKLKNPRFFKENQKGENPHDNMDPRESAKIIVNHVPYGLELAHRYKLPRDVQKIIAQHHGDSIVPFFRYKAEQCGLEIDEAVFKYPGSKPATKEGAIVMLADIVEAAVRSMDDPDRDQVKDMIDKLIRAKYNDGQLDECPLNRRDLNSIAKAFVHMYDGALHERVKYPDQE